MNYKKEYFELNLIAAHKIGQILNIKLSEALFKYTNIYHALLIDRKFSNKNSRWLQYTNSLSQMNSFEEELEHTLFCYKKNRDNLDKRIVEPEFKFGCFGYEIWDNKRIRLHFKNIDIKGDTSALHRSKISRRISELREMFLHLKDKDTDDFFVHGRSWLYNLKSYRRLFPASYFLNTTNADPYYSFQRINLWGQFLTWDGNVKQRLANTFISKLSNINTKKDYLNAFPYKVLINECPVKNFYEYYLSINS